MADGDRVALTDEDDEERSALGERVRTAGTRLARRANPAAVRRRHDNLSQRVARLEEQLAQERRLQRRVAELTDLVLHALLPPEQRDDDEIRRRLESFAKDQ